MSFQTWMETINAVIADATAIANTTTETSIYQQTVPAGYFYPGRAMHIKAFGKLSVTGTPTITFVLRWGGAVSGVLLATTEAITNGSGLTNVNWSVDLEMICRSSGTAGTFLAFGEAKVQTNASGDPTSKTNIFSVSGSDAPAVSASADTTVEKVLALCATWGTQSASNTLTGMYCAFTSRN